MYINVFETNNLMINENLIFKIFYSHACVFSQRIYDELIVISNEYLLP